MAPESQRALCQFRQGPLGQSASAPRRLELAVLLLATSVCMACNPIMAPFILMGGLDPQQDAEFSLTGKDKNAPVKVVVLASAPLETRPELIGADRDLAGLLSAKLQQASKRNNENVLLASANKVQRFKDDHPMWKSLGLDEIGRRLDADYVIDLEINSLSLYEPRSQNTFFKGAADISVTVVDVHKVDEGPAFRKEYTGEYPHSQGPRPVSDTNPQRFRQEFLTSMATELAWYFARHPTSEHHSCD